MTVEELFGPGDLGDPVLARPVAPVSAPGSRVALATVGDTFVALPLDADLAARLGFGAAGGLMVGGGENQGGREVQGGQGARSRCGRSGRRGPRSWWPATTRRCRCSRRRSRCSTRRWRSPGGRAAAARPCGWPRPGWCTPPACTVSARGRRDTSGIPGGAEVVGFASWREGLVVRPGAQVRGLDDVARQGLRLVNREPGAQARTLLDRERLRLAWSRPGFPATTAWPPATCRWRRPSSAAWPTRACPASQPRWPTGWTSSRWPRSVSTCCCRPSTPRPRGPGPAEGAHLAVAAGPAGQPARLRRRPVRRAPILISA